STLPALSQARYLTVVVCDTVIGSLYAVLEAVGSEPSSVYRMTLTPLSPSLAARVTVTSVAYAALEHADPSQAIDDVGAVVSIWISCEFTASALPTLSKARNWRREVRG